MLDIKIIRKNVEIITQAMLNRNKKIDFGQLLKLDNERKFIIGEIEGLRLRRNKKSEEIGRFRREEGEVLAELFKETGNIRTAIQELEKRFLIVENQIENFLLDLPNIPDEDVPIGGDESYNKIIRFIGQPKRFSFKPKHHWEIGKELGILDFKTASKISGSRFAVLRNDGCVLERAIITFFLDTHKTKGYQEIMTPYLVNTNSMIGTGQLPRFEEEAFKCVNDDLYLIPTAEVPVTNIYRDEVLEESFLPQKFVSYSACFRRESGSYGRDTKGLVRNHQFNKVELVKFVSPETSNEELDSLVVDVRNVLELLDLPYRVVLLSTGDMAFSSAKTYDLEVWFAGDGVYREVSSCSNFKDFQARRMNIKVKYSQNNRKKLLHTLNGSGVAIGRTFAAILENYQQENGSVVIPEVLRKYTGFSIIESR
ncbi:MAG: serine--tRNA ligase [Endomicrobium sp.]|jgi:seryl-tRNA synthetase|nr:serine--tRNA ligase [Endomicrobium sp.]